MGDNSKIEWTDATWNPVAGCSKVSPGCKFCYAMRQAHRLASNPNPKISARYEGLTHIVNGHPEWTGAARLNEDTLELPLHWKRPRRIFVNSLSDLFQEALSIGEIWKVLAITAIADHHEFQILTKRGERMESILPRGIAHASDYIEDAIDALRYPARPPALSAWPLPNVRLGVSIEDGERAIERFPAVCDLGEAGWKTMVSLEPLLGFVRIPARYLALGKSAWVIAGGESGTGARPPHPNWIRCLQAQCFVAGVPFFFKQWGEWRPENTDAEQKIRLTAAGRNGSDLANAGDGGDVWMSRVGKKAAGALLDGREWREFPEGMKV